MTVNELLAQLNAAVAKDASVGVLQVLHIDDTDETRTVDSIQVEDEDVLLMEDDDGEDDDEDEE